LKLQIFFSKALPLRERESAARDRWDVMKERSFLRPRCAAKVGRINPRDAHRLGLGPPAGEALDQLVRK
jgi:hypothetical protein